jgi:hypothetical protein
MAKPPPLLTIASFPGQVIEISCSRCGRRSVHAKARLARVYGDTISIEDLIGRLTGNCSIRQTAREGAHCAASVRTPFSPLIIDTSSPLADTRPDRRKAVSRGAE